MVSIRHSKMAAPSMTQQQISRYRVIETELSTGITYCRAALSSGDPGRKICNLEQAERAYQVAIEYARTSKLSPAIRQSVEYKSECLRELLHQHRTKRVIFKLEPVKPELLNEPKVA
jgi:hypothetical protein